MKIHFKTFGCKVNQCETNEMIQQVVNCGVEISHHDDADSIIINTCTVTEESDRKARQFIGKIKRVNPEAEIFMTGCYVDRAEKEIRDKLPEGVGVKFFKNSQKQNILNILNLSPLTTHHLPLTTFYNHTRAFIKIQDGCNGKCTYCIVPSVRPVLKSTPLDDVLSQVKNYIKSGYKEIVLCGVRLGKYYDENRKVNILGLLKKIVSIKAEFRVRLSSIEFEDISQDLIDYISATDKICRHLHIPLQSGDDSVLMKMGRNYTTEGFLEKILYIRKKISDIGVTTDIITGFPKEGEREFENTVSFIKKVNFSRLHVFPFSPRPKTPAYFYNKNKNDEVITRRFKHLPAAGVYRDSVDKALCNKRARILIDIDADLRYKFSGRFIGKELTVLIERKNKGFSENYIPVEIKGATLRPNNFYKVVITGVSSRLSFGKIKN